MSHLFTETNTQFEEKLKSWLKGAQAIVGATYSAPTLTVDPKGRKYIRIVREGGNSRSVYAFIVKATGDVMMPASWAAPAKHPRGNIFNADNGLTCCGPYGIAYLR